MTLVQFGHVLDLGYDLGFILLVRAWDIFQVGLGLDLVDFEFNNWIWFGHDIGLMMHIVFGYWFRLEPWLGLLDYGFVLFIYLFFKFGWIRDRFGLE